MVTKTQVSYFQARGQAERAILLIDPADCRRVFGGDDSPGIVSTLDSQWAEGKNIEKTIAFMICRHFAAKHGESYKEAGRNGYTSKRRKTPPIKVFRATALTHTFGKVAEVEEVGTIELEFDGHPVTGDAHVAYSGGFSYWNLNSTIKIG